MDNQRNLFITIALSVLVLTLWQVFYMNPRIEQQRETARIEAERAARQSAQQGTGQAPTPAAGGQATGPTTTGQQPAGAVPGQGTVAGQPAANRAESIAAGKRVPIDTPSLSGSINLVGARLDDLVLKHYRETVEPNSPNIDLLNPAG